MKKWNFEIVSKMLLDLCNKLGKIPTWENIKNEKDFPSDKPIKRLFKDYDGGYVQYCKNNGYEYKIKKSNISKFEYTTYNELCEMWENFYNQYGYYPTAKEYNWGNLFGLPPMRNIHIICGNRFYEFVEKYGIYRGIKHKTYEQYIDIFKETYKELGRPLLTIELDRNNKFSDILPSHQWLINNCPDKSVKTYNDLLKWVGIERPKTSNYKCIITKEEAIEKILEKQNLLDRPIQGKDFKNIKDDGVGIKIIKRYWGTFNNMLIELELPINQEDRLCMHKSIDEMKQDIIKLCNYIKETEGRISIDYEDVNNCEWCSHSDTYHKYFKQYLNISLGDFIESIGFLTGSSIGTRFVFGNKERATSKYEYEVSKYLRENNIYYERNVLYRKFTIGYGGKMNCDYKIIYNGIPWYVEIAGMLAKQHRNKDISTSKIINIYKRKLRYKEWLLKLSDANYRILYPEDLKKPLDEVFSFLGSVNTYWEVSTQ